MKSVSKKNKRIKTPIVVGFVILIAIFFCFMLFNNNTKKYYNNEVQIVTNKDVATIRLLPDSTNYIKDLRNLISNDFFQSLTIENGQYMIKMTQRNMNIVNKNTNILNKIRKSKYSNSGLYTHKKYTISINKDFKNIDSIYIAKESVPLFDEDYIIIGYIATKDDIFSNVNEVSIINSYLS